MNKLKNFAKEAWGLVKKHPVLSIVAVVVLGLLVVPTIVYWVNHGIRKVDPTGKVPELKAAKAAGAAA